MKIPIAVALIFGLIVGMCLIAIPVVHYATVEIEKLNDRLDRVLDKVDWLTDKADEVDGLRQRLEKLADRFGDEEPTGSIDP